MAMFNSHVCLPEGDHSSSRIFIVHEVLSRPRYPKVLPLVASGLPNKVAAMLPAWSTKTNCLLSLLFGFSLAHTQSKIEMKRIKGGFPDFVPFQFLNLRLTSLTLAIAFMKLLVVTMLQRRYIAIYIYLCFSAREKNVILLPITAWIGKDLKDPK